MPKFAADAVPEIVIVSGGEFVAVMVMLPFKGFTDAVATAPGIAARQALRLASVRAFGGEAPGPNVMVVVLAPTVMTSVCPVDTAPCVSRLVAFVVPAVRPS